MEQPRPRRESRPAPPEYEEPRQERAKTPEERRLIEGILRHLREFVASYRGRAPTLTAEHIHFVDRLSGRSSRGRQNGHERGYYVADLQQVVVHPDGDTLRDAEAIVHELLHAASFTSYAGEDGGLRVVERLGLQEISPDQRTSRFRFLDEAVISELTKRFDQRYFGSLPELEEALERRRTVRAGVRRDPDDVAAAVTRESPSGRFETTFYPYAYPEARQDLWRLVRDLYAPSGHFGSEEEVFEVFAQAAFTGRREELVRLVDGTLGEGSFSQWGERTSWRRTDDALSRSFGNVGR